jgi:hypothetical protein
MCQRVMSALGHSRRFCLVARCPLRGQFRTCRFPGLVSVDLRAAAKAYNDVLDAELPDGPDKTFVIRAHRSNAMWANVAITRLPDGDAASVMPAGGFWQLTKSNGDDLGNDLRTIHHIRNDENLDFAQIGVRIVGVILECCLDVKTNGGTGDQYIAYCDPLIGKIVVGLFVSNVEALERPFELQGFCLASRNVLRRPDDHHRAVRRAA